MTRSLPRSKTGWGTGHAPNLGAAAMCHATSPKRRRSPDVPSGRVAGVPIDTPGTRGGGPVTHTADA